MLPADQAEAPWDIAFKNVRLGYGDHVVLDNLTTSLPKGQISVILGGSGCGKSTLLRHIIGLNQPLKGEISINGRNLAELNKRDLVRIRRRLGVLFQDGALLGALTVSENVVLPLSEHFNFSKQTLQQEAKRVLSMVQLEDFADFYPHELSGGMRKRAGLARAIVANPKILLCDEPTSGLDPITAAHMDELLLALHREFQDMTIVVVSHDLASLKRIAQFVLVLGQGQCLFQGDLTALEESTDPYLQNFLQRRALESNFSFVGNMQSNVSSELHKWFQN